jgi:hypothetical protein
MVVGNTVPGGLSSPPPPPHPGKRKGDAESTGDECYVRESFHGRILLIEVETRRDILTRSCGSMCAAPYRRAPLLWTSF